MTLFHFGCKIATEIHKKIHDAKYGRQVCTCGGDLTKRDIEGYPHGDGWNVYRADGTRIGKFWLYIVCPKCGYEWALWKLGVDRTEEFREE